MQRLHLSQNHRTVYIGQKLWIPSHPDTLLKKGQPKQVPQDYVQSSYEHFQGWTFHNLSECTILARIEGFLIVTHMVPCISVHVAKKIQNSY